MIIGRTRSNIREQIENQYENLLLMIGDIADRYQKEAVDFENEVDRIAKECSNGDYEIHSDLKYSYLNEIIRKFSMLVEARRILFCSIFSYCESMLYGIVDYYIIPIGNTKGIVQLINKIFKEYEKRYSELLSVSNDADNTIRNYYRPLRNYFMHGKISKENDKVNLRFYAQTNDGIFVTGSKDRMEIEIADNEYLRSTLATVNRFLIEIEESYNVKQRRL